MATAAGEVPSGYLDRMRELFPELEGVSVAFNGEGLANDVVFAERLVFRFPKTQAGPREIPRMPAKPG